MVLKAGDKIPEILGRNQDGQTIKASDYKGKKLVLYFYPKDNTQGCTAEACSFRDNYAALRKAGYEVVGVSVDSEQSHRKFIEKQQLPFNLIADTDKTLVEQFGVWGEKSMYGRKYMGAFRTTFLVDENGVVEYIFQSKEIAASTHAVQIMQQVTKEK
jgi:peroxiredoxin Q/BCP